MKHNIFMFLILVLFLSSFIILNQEVQAQSQSQSYQFLLMDNSINLELFQPVALPSQDLSSKSYDKNILSFKYKIQADKNLPSDIPLFLVAFGDEVIFYADASKADGFFHEVSLNLKPYFLTNDWSLPVFYKNQYFTNLNLELTAFNFLDDLNFQSNDSYAINDLNVIRELDQSLTVIFSLAENERQAHFYELVCLDNTSQEMIHSRKLIVSDSFLWGGFEFVNLLSNAKKELIFHLSSFNCEGSFYVLVDGEIKSTTTEAIGIKDL